MLDEKDLQALLRLKRYEKPPPEYYESFLREFHRRQREEMLRQPLWRLVADRVSAFLSEHSLPRYSYATATAGVVVAGVLASGLVLQPAAPEGELARVAPSGPRFSQPASKLALNPGANEAILAEQPFMPERPPIRSNLQPRYVIDARPASYEPPSSF